MYVLLQEGRINVEMFIAEREIRDKGKADSALKTFTLLQILWLVLQSISRAIEHLPLMPLEISTLAYIPCAVFIFWLWWDKPYAINVPTILDIAPPPKTAGLHRSNTYGAVPRRYDRYSKTKQCWCAMRSSVLPINRAGYLPSIVGAIHLAAWDFDFPSRFERQTWRVCSVVTSVSIPISWTVVGAVLWCIGSPSSKEKGARGRYCRMLVGGTVFIQGIGVGLYTLARLYLLVEVFVAFRAMPRDVYKTPEWSVFVPHVH